MSLPEYPHFAVCTNSSWAAQFLAQPGPGKNPLALDGTDTRAKKAGDLGHRETAEETHVHHLGEIGMLVLQPGQRTVEQDEIFAR